MSLKRIPIIPTLIVLAAVALMVRLGFWQLDRLHQKEAMLARYQAAQGSTAPVALPRHAGQAEAVLFHHARATCVSTSDDRAISGHNRRDVPGFAHIVRCRLPGATANLADPGQPIVAIDVVTGWSRDPNVPEWQGGEVEGVLAPSKNAEHFKLISATPLVAGQEANALPDPNDIPNNHLSYAVQWFLFAVTALVIYALALRKRMKE